MEMERKKTRQIHIGPVAIGGGAPVSVQSMNEVISYTRYPYFRQLRMVDTVWDTDKMNILMPSEIRNFALYLCENEHNFLYIMNTYQNNIECEIIKFMILNDYLTGNLSADEEAIFKECEKEYLNNLDIKKYEFIYQYILFRQLELTLNHGIKKIIDYAVYSIIFIMLYERLYHDDIEAVRRWSEQIEYNEDNIVIILDELN